MASMGELKTTENVVDTNFPSGSWKLIKMKNVKYLTYV